MKSRPKIVFVSTILLFLGVTFFMVAPSAYVIDKPGLALNVLGEYNGKKLINFGDDIFEPQTQTSGGQILMLTVSVYGGPSAYVPSVYAVSSLFSKNEQIVPVEAVYSPHTSGKEATKQTTVQMESSQKACVEAVQHFIENSSVFSDVQKKEALAKLTSTKFDVSDIGGPSAGLAFSLGLLQKLGSELGIDLTNGKIVAVTGTIDGKSGNVGAIGGVSQKIVAASRSGAKIMLAPRSNLTELDKVPGGVQVYGVDNLTQAVDILRSL